MAWLQREMPESPEVALTRWKTQTANDSKFKFVIWLVSYDLSVAGTTREPLKGEISKQVRSEGAPELTLWSGGPMVCWPGPLDDWVLALEWPSWGHSHSNVLGAWPQPQGSPGLKNRLQKLQDSISGKNSLSFFMPIPGQCYLTISWVLLWVSGGGQRVLLEVCTAWTMHFWEKYIRKQLQSAHNLVGAGLVRLGPGPHLDVRR